MRNGNFGEKYLGATSVVKKPPLCFVKNDQVDVPSRKKDILCQKY